jgi:hypothetical protein
MSSQKDPDSAPPPGPVTPASPDKAPPGPVTPASPEKTPTGPDTTGTHEVMFQGKVQLYTCGISETTFMDFSDTALRQVYATCWIDGERGKSAHVEFPVKGMPGQFQLSLPFRDGDPEWVKVQLSMRMRDEETNNRRTAELCMSHADMTPMLRGEVDAFRMPNQFNEGTYADVALLIPNAAEFRNHPTSAQDMSKPLLTLSPSKLAGMVDHNKDMRKLSAAVTDVLHKNDGKAPPGGEPFLDGMSRLPRALLALSLLLGTPAYVFFCPAAGRMGGA